MQQAVEVYAGVVCVERAGQSALNPSVDRGHLHRIAVKTSP